MAYGFAVLLYKRGGVIVAFKVVDVLLTNLAFHVFCSLQG